MGAMLTRTGIFSLCVLSTAAASLEAAVIPGTNIEARIRPIVWTQYSGAPTPSGNNTVVAIWDTGDPWETMSRETALQLGLAPTTPMIPGGSFGGNSALRNNGVIAQQDVQSSGWFGARFDGPERMTPAPPGGWADIDLRAGDPSHVFTSATVAASNPVTSSGLYNWYGDYNNGFSETHTGMPFVTSSVVADNMTAFVDPINATPLPFAYDNSNGGNNRGLGGASLPLDSRTSSVSFYNKGSARIPDPVKNANAGFTHFVNLRPQQFSSTLVPADGQAVLNAALPAGVDRRITIEVSPANAANGIALYPKTSNPQFSFTVGDLAGTTTYAEVSNVFEVRNETIRAGGEVDSRGFVRDDGTVQINVISKDALGAVTNHMTQTVRLPSSTPRPYGTVNIPALGINTGANNILIDTGAPTTSASIIGTDTLNRFGQFWDFAPQNAGAGNNNGRLTLYAPSNPEVISAVAKGMLFGVDGNTTGAQATAVRHEATLGSIPQFQPGGAATLSDGVDANQSRVIFRSHLTASNATYIDEEALNLDGGGQPNMISMSTGKDTINGDIFFSVAPSSVGEDGSVVKQQSMRNQVGSDIFKRARAGITNDRSLGASTLFINQETMGLGAFAGPGFTVPLAERSNDNLSSLDMFTDKAMHTGSFSNLDSPILSHNDAGTAARPRVGADRLGAGGNFDTYFTTDVPGPTAIYRSDFGAGGEFATYLQMGLVEGDIIDAMSMFRPSIAPGILGAPALDPGNDRFSPFVIDDEFRYDPNTNGAFAGIDWGFGLDSDLVMFSLGFRSPTLAQYNLSPADLFITDFDGTFTLAVTAESLGLKFFDNVDALDNLIIEHVPVPEPATLVLIGLSCTSLLRRRGCRSH